MPLPPWLPRGIFPRTAGRSVSAPLSAPAPTTGLARARVHAPQRTAPLRRSTSGPHLHPRSVRLTRKWLRRPTSMPGAPGRPPHGLRRAGRLGGGRNAHPPRHHVPRLAAGEQQRVVCRMRLKSRALLGQRTRVRLPRLRLDARLPRPPPNKTAATSTLAVGGAHFRSHRPRRPMNPLTHSTTTTR